MPGVEHYGRIPLDKHTNELGHLKLVDPHLLAFWILKACTSTTQE